VWRTQENMRVAVVSDIHGNLTALEAVIADLKDVSPDLIVHGGDLVASGFRPAEVVDRIRQLGWPGVLGNTDEMLWNPDRLAALRDTRLRGLGEALRHIAIATAERIGPERIDWLRTLPTTWRSADLIISVVHASPEDLWRAPLLDASDENLECVYGSLRTAFVMYGHIHRSFIRTLPTQTVANCGSVSLSYDDDPRASYLVVENGKGIIRRVEYEIDREVIGLRQSQYPHADWIGRILQTGHFRLPPSNERVGEVS